MLAYSPARKFKINKNQDIFSFKTKNAKNSYNFYISCNQPTRRRDHGYDSEKGKVPYLITFQIKGEGDDKINIIQFIHVHHKEEESTDSYDYEMEGPVNIRQEAGSLC